MKTFLQIILGLIIGAIFGGLVGLLLGELAVELFEISCFEGYCGYVVALYILLGGFIGIIGGGVLAYKWRNSNSTLSRWFYTIIGALLGYLVARLILAVTGLLLVALLNSNLLNETIINLILPVYNIVFTYGVIIVCIVGSGVLVYRMVSNQRKVAAVESGG